MIMTLQPFHSIEVIAFTLLRQCNTSIDPVIQ